MIRKRRFATAVAVLAFGFTSPVVMAGPAQATAKDCIDYLADKGYIIGPKVRGICSAGGVKCPLSFVKIGVASSHADVACKLVEKP